MKRRAVVSGLVAGGLGVTAYVAWAGDLNPPPGEVATSMHSLEDIYQAVRANDPCQTCLWNFVSTTPPEHQFHQVIPGPALLHSVVLNPNVCIKLYDCGNLVDITAEDQVATFMNSGPGNTLLTLDLDIPFAKGVVVLAWNNNEPIVFKYRPN